VFEESVLRRIIGSKREKIIENLRKLHNKEIRNLYFSINIIRMIKWRSMRPARRVA
jgi:hypothetical protein